MYPDCVLKIPMLSNLKNFTFTVENFTDVILKYILVIYTENWKGEEMTVDEILENLKGFTGILE